MKVKSAKFIKSAGRPDQYPDPGLPEIAFAGRSNVGKSSLINSLTGRKGLVKVSGTPGKTRTLNFFLINERLVFTDMPGYGFARVPLSEKKKWGKMVEAYLGKRKQLRAVVSILDCRRTPNDDDRMLLDWLRHNKIPVIIVFTKIDKVPKTRRPGKIKKALEAISEFIDEGAGPVLYSSLTGEGKRELWAVIRAAAEKP